ncbi:MAG TPA: GlsB/YeaQ/YmgE family stress response membrane protein [Herpetosiphonaceae bacterium]
MSVMGLIIWLIVGGIVGWLASIIMRTDAQQGLLLNIVVGIIGALLGGWLFGAIFNEGTINQNPLDLGSILVSLLGAVVLLGIVNLFRRGSVR